VRIHLSAKHALEFEPAYAGLEPAGVTLEVARRGFIVLALGQLEQLRRIADRRVGAVELVEFLGQARALAPELLGALGRAPDGRMLEFAAYFFESFLLAVVLKETPSRRRHAPRDL
jgi:hypothetical protein